MSKKSNGDNEKNIQDKELIKNILESVKKRYGDEAIMLLSHEENLEPIETISTGSYLLNEALGIGGYPKGRIIEIYGPESSGKTTLCLHAVAEVQKNHGIAAYIDAEHSLDPLYAKNLGVNLSELIISQPDSGEQALEIVDILAKSGQLDLIVVDSVAALVPEAELNGDMKDQSIGLQARLMSKALRKITGSLNKNKTTILFINQIREKIGVMFGNPETTTGGRALKFYSSIRLEIRKSTMISDGKDITGNEVKIKVTKNKLAPPYKTINTEIIFSQGIDNLSELIDLGVEKNILEKRGSWYIYKNNNIAQGKKQMKNFLKNNFEFYENLKKEILN